MRVIYRKNKCVLAFLSFIAKSNAFCISITKSNAFFYHISFNCGAQLHLIEKSNAFLTSITKCGAFLATYSLFAVHPNVPIVIAKSNSFLHYFMYRKIKCVFEFYRKSKCVFEFLSFMSKALSPYVVKKLIVNTP